MEKIFQIFFSHCPRMENLHRIINEIAKIDVPVLIKGEGGTGKKLVAQAIHNNSRRRGKPLIKVNCAAIPGTLTESELFGFERGAFTGANLMKPGKFELASGGTIILSNIDEIDISVQPKLLQVLQDGAFSRLGGNGDIQVDTRIITTTNEDLERSINLGRFREDLYFRINVIGITIPPLRERKEQVLPLAQYFFDLNRKKYGTLTPFLSLKAIKYFQDYDWPGNVRELETIVKRIVLFGEEEVLKGPLISLPRRIATHLSSAPGQENNLPGGQTQTLKRIGRDAAEAAEREYIEKALHETHWNRKEAAKILKISYKALLYKIKGYQLN